MHSGGEIILAQEIDGIVSRGVSSKQGPDAGNAMERDPHGDLELEGGEVLSCDGLCDGMFDLQSRIELEKIKRICGWIEEILNSP